eukprot:14533966-Alexandrium_andersonii.AAC.1
MGGEGGPRWSEDTSCPHGGKKDGAPCHDMGHEARQQCATSPASGCAAGGRVHAELRRPVRSYCVKGRQQQLLANTHTTRRT